MPSRLPLTHMMSYDVSLRSSVKQIHTPRQSPHRHHTCCGRSYKAKVCLQAHTPPFHWPTCHAHGGTPTCTWRYAHMWLTSTYPTMSRPPHACPHKSSQHSMPPQKQGGTGVLHHTTTAVCGYSNWVPALLWYQPQQHPPGKRKSCHVPPQAALKVDTQGQCVGQRSTQVDAHRHTMTQTHITSAASTTTRSPIPTHTTPYRA